MTEDIPRFWEAYDAASRDTALAAQAAAFERLYLAPGTDGLLAYIQNKVGRAESLARRVGPMREYYDAIRPQTLAMSEIEPELRAALRRLTDVYPDATFPDVTLVIGALTSGGTALDQGLLLGVEMNATTPETPLGSLPDYARRIVGRAEKLPLIVVHELVHANQDMDSTWNVLRAALIEGGADFISELAMGGDFPEPPYRTWGREHEREVWTRFMAEKDSTDFGDWTGNSGMAREGWVGDLGYYVGYEISRTYYEQADDKRQAVRDLLEMRDPEAILIQSGYPERFADVSPDPE